MLGVMLGVREPASVGVGAGFLLSSLTPFVLMYRKRAFLVQDFNAGYSPSCLEEGPCEFVGYGVLGSPGIYLFYLCLASHTGG
jgi:hypothetical protein